MSIKLNCLYVCCWPFFFFFFPYFINNVFMGIHKQYSKTLLNIIQKLSMKLHIIFYRCYEKIADLFLWLLLTQKLKLNIILSTIHLWVVLVKINSVPGSLNIFMGNISKNSFFIKSMINIYIKNCFN